MNRVIRLFMTSLLPIVFVSSGLIFFSPHSAITSAKSDEQTAIPNKKVPVNHTLADEIWQEFDRARVEPQMDAGIPDQSRVLQLDRIILANVLRRAPVEFRTVEDNSVILPIPMPDGTFANFRIEESSVLEPSLAEQYPQIKSYRGQSVDNPALTMRCDFTPQGFHALILDGGKTINILPASADDASVYVSFYGDEIEGGKHECLAKDVHQINPGRFAVDAPQVAVGATLRNYRIAIATTFEYSNTYGGGTNAGTISSLNTWLNNANAIYERDLAIHLNLVGDIDVLYTAERGFTAATDPYNNDSAGAMVDVARSDLNTKVGAANYDLGHVFGTFASTGGSGVAYVGVVCLDFDNGDSFGPLKGGGATRFGGAPGNVFALGVFAHELGHQFGANHNFNGTVDNCGPSQRSEATSYESGSGSTIMGYAGICGADNITNTTDVRFHATSYGEINSHIAGVGSCFIPTATGNAAPTVNGGGNRKIPKNTPFTLTAIGGDANAADLPNLTYTWDQIDAGGSLNPQNGTSASYNDASDSAMSTRPIFRPFPATSSPARTFPSLTYILNNANDPPDTVGGFQTAEELPRIGRTVNFRVTVRDNRAGFGGVNEDTVTLTVDNNSGPFLVTAPNAAVSFPGATTQTITWSVNNTNNAPIGVSNVRILLSTDGGNTFPIALAASTANDGTEAVTIPNMPTTTARVKVEAVGNIFFDVSNANFAITPGSPTSASVSVGGRVANMSGRGISQARVMLTDMRGVTRYALTNAFGYYHFNEVAAGETYIIEARHKRYRFPARVIAVTDDIFMLDFTALP